MARDHRRLRVFCDAHSLAIAIYRQTRHFPREEWYGIRLQMRRAAVSASSNIVEGNARRSTRDYVNFLNISRGSSAELHYLIDLSGELGYLSGPELASLNELCARVIRQLEALIKRMDGLAAAESGPKPKDPRPKTRD